MKQKNKRQVAKNEKRKRQEKDDEIKDLKELIDQYTNANKIFRFLRIIIKKY